MLLIALLRIVLCGIGLVALHACVESEDPALAFTEQAEIIDVHGCSPGYLELGEGENTTCIGDPQFTGGGAGDPGGGPSGPTGLGGPGGGGGGPGPIPDRKVCTGLEHSECYACCDYNLERVDGERCRRLRSPKRREKCWSEAEEILGKCQRSCPPAPRIALR